MDVPAGTLPADRVVGPGARRTMTRVLVMSGLLLLAVLFSGKVARKMPDLEVYWTAAVRARAAEPLYRIEDGHYQFKYLPAFAVFAIPGGAVPLHVAKSIWYLVSIALVASLVTLSLSILPERRKPVPVLVVVTVLAMAKFFAHEIVLGQMNALFAVVVVGAVVALRRRREPVAGLLIALAIVVKPYAVIFLPWLFARRRPGSVLTASISLAGIIAVPALVYGLAGNIEQHRAWWKTVTESTAPNLTNADNVSVAAMFAKWMGAGSAASTLALITSLLILVGAGLVFVRRRRVTFPEGLEAAFLLTCIPLLSPQGWDYVFLVSTPAIMYLVNYHDLLPRPWQLLAAAAVGTIAFSVYDLMGRAAYGAFMALSIVTICYLVVIGALGALRARAVA
jgi:arabinofuranan 3-O-arabinosyltransferase